MLALSCRPSGLHKGAGGGVANVDYDDYERETSGCRSGVALPGSALKMQDRKATDQIAQDERRAKMARRNLTAKVFREVIDFVNTICCVPCISRSISPAGRVAAKFAAMVSCWDRQTDGRTPERRIDSAPHTVRPLSKTSCAIPLAGS